MDAFIAILIWIISIIVLSVIGGEIRFRYLKKKIKKQEDNEEQTDNEKIIGGGFPAGGGTTLF